MDPSLQALGRRASWMTSPKVSRLKSLTRQARMRPLGSWRIVADNGPGTPAEERARVFERFYRLGASRTTEGNGRGSEAGGAILKN